MNEKMMIMSVRQAVEQVQVTDERLQERAKQVGWWHAGGSLMSMPGVASCHLLPARAAPRSAAARTVAASASRCRQLSRRWVVLPLAQPLLCYNLLLGPAAAATD